ncbi:MAG: hypothetical protein J7L11_08900 [Thermoprotei archaeon]|nr:hypothetical protein [Thermoprotei archaeon]
MPALIIATIASIAAIILIASAAYIVVSMADTLAFRSARDEFKLSIELLKVSTLFDIEDKVSRSRLS